VKTKIYNVLCVIFGLLLINGGLDKFLHYMPVPENLPAELVKDTAAFMEISWLMPLIGSVELLGGLLVIIPRTRALAAILVTPVMTGVLFTHFTVAPDGIPVVIVIWLILGWIIFENWGKYLALIK
jgi:putative oxidoreductase